MNTGDIVLVPFPFSELTKVKVRPAIVVTTTKDKYKDLILCAVSSVVPSEIRDCEILLNPNKTNNLRATSVAKTDRIVTLKREIVITKLGKLTITETKQLINKFKGLIE